jgi:hypothetical protein
LIPIIAAVTDTHCGGTTALAPAEYITKEGQTIQASKAQNWIEASWLDYWDWVKTETGIRGKHRKNKLVVLHLGDAIDGNHHKTTQILPDIGDQQDMFCELFRPIVAMADEVIFCYGTEPHVGPNSRDEKRICDELGIRNQGYYLTLDLDGLTFDLAHHGRAGGKPWTSSAAGFAAEVCQDYIEEGRKPPRYILRGHHHHIDDSGEKLPHTRYIALPAFQLRTAFGWKVGQGRSDIGGLLFINGEPSFKKARYTAAPGGRTIVRPAWTLPKTT